MKILDESREARPFTLEDEVRASLATAYAAAVDRATSSGDVSKLLTAGSKLVELLESLRAPVTGGEEAGNVDGGDPRAKLYAVMDGPPAVGDASHA